MARIGCFDVRLVNAEQRRLERQMEDYGQKAAEAMISLGKYAHSKKYKLPDGRVVYQKLWTDVPELRRGEVIITSVPDVDFFQAYITDQDNRGLGGNYDAKKRAFESLLRAVGRRAPFEDLFAEEKGHYLSLKRNAEPKGESPQSLEENQVSNFEGELSAVIERAPNFDDLMVYVTWLITKYSQLLPYKLKTVFFADTENSPNFERCIEERFDAEARKSVSDYVKQNTNDPIFTMLKLVTIDATGMVSDDILSRDSPVRFDAAHYLAALRHYDSVYKKQARAEKKQVALERRISEEKIKMGDLKKGISFYLDHIIKNPLYSVSVERQGGAFALEKLSDAEHIIATVVAVHENFSEFLMKLAEDYKESGERVSWCSHLNFPYPMKIF